jgi:hypothetical protein
VSALPPPPQRPEYALVGAEVGLIYGLALAVPAWEHGVFPIIPVIAFLVAGFLIGFILFDIFPAH